MYVVKLSFGNISVELNLFVITLLVITECDCLSYNIFHYSQEIAFLNETFVVFVLFRITTFFAIGKRQRELIKESVDTRERDRGISVFAFLKPNKEGPGEK